MASQLEGLALSARERKNQENKQKLYDAAAQIMEMYDYNTVTIRNICKVSGVSYGSFYNLFDSKETFLRYYLTNDFTAYMEDYFNRMRIFSKKILWRNLWRFSFAARIIIWKKACILSAVFIPQKIIPFFPKPVGRKNIPLRLWYSRAKSI